MEWLISMCWLAYIKSSAIRGKIFFFSDVMLKIELVRFHPQMDERKVLRVIISIQLCCLLFTIHSAKFSALAVCVCGCRCTYIVVYSAAKGSKLLLTIRARTPARNREKFMNECCWYSVNTVCLCVKAPAEGGSCVGLSNEFLAAVWGRIERKKRKFCALYDAKPKNVP